MDAVWTNRKRYAACALGALLMALLLGAATASPAYADEGNQATGQGIQSPEVSTLGLQPDPMWFNAVNAPAGTWKQSGSKWWYEFEDGSYAAAHCYRIAGAVYSFDASGWMQTGWLQDSCSNWYYFKSSGKQAFGWEKIGGVWYYFEADPSCGGNMYQDMTMAIDGNIYCFDKNGHMVTSSWLQDEGGYWLYFKASGDAATGWYRWDGKWYFFVGWDEVYKYHIPYASMYTGWLWDEGAQNYRYLHYEDGYMVTGWREFAGHWYYFDPAKDGLQTLGWKKIGGVWYYFDPDPDYGEMYYGGIYTIDAASYAFDDNGAMQTGWFKMDGDWYYARSNGTLLKAAWQKDSAGWCYLDGVSGAMWVNSWKKDSVGWCYIGPDGHCVKNVANYPCTGEGEYGHPPTNDYSFDVNGHLIDGTYPVG